MKFELAAILSVASMGLATPPGIPSAATAASRLGSLTARTPVDDGTYDRDLFPHWVAIADLSEYVLRRDGTNVVTGSDCYPTSGTWKSPYDGGSWTAPSDVDIDHMVPLKNAWISGASEWTTARRQAFANDISGPQLWAVTDNVNQAKGDKSPDSWKPPLTSFYCVYARAWIQVKYSYDLSVSAAEQSALESMLDRC